MRENIIRLAANTGARLHMIRPLGFRLDDSKLKRAGLDYHEWARVEVHDNFEAFLEKHGSLRRFALSSKATRDFYDIRFQAHDVLIFGPETRGLPASLMDVIFHKSIA